MPQFQPFEMERMMSRFEQEVEYNLSESGVHPVLLSELLGDDPDAIKELLALDLNYAYANGTPELRNHITKLYDDASEENILVTVGAAEANYITIRTLLSEGDEIAVMLPNYMQIWGIAKNHKLSVREFHLREDSGWALDVDGLRKAVTPKTRLIAVCNPDNPTGYILTDAEMKAVCDAAASVGAWILADEVYSGAERLSDQQTPSFFGRYDKVIAVGSLSKAYGLPGLRIGWAVAPAATIDEIWKRHEYTTLSATRLSNALATLALSPSVRSRLIARARKYIRDGYAILENWMKDRRDIFDMVPPQAAAIGFARYHLDINSTEFTERLRKEKSVLIVPGDHFGLDAHLRVSFGLPHDYLIPALDRMHELVASLAT
ncbi:aminotransferase class I/II-fold pyridoxal phosphate-dependent enzyme [Candidatus Eisenbacteria bacterium]|uniref:Aminotransferase n=1 Tax=Eiseniibacteriota bacterium TaxID=2212470 RepID=A0ABV6YJ29_UNCEI